MTKSTAIGEAMYMSAVGSTFMQTFSLTAISRFSAGGNNFSMMTHIGLSLMSEWNGKRRASAVEVRNAMKLKDFHPFSFDGISIRSNFNVLDV